MNNINVYYCIVPINDGYHYVCQNKNTQELYLCHKALDDNDEALIFHSIEKAKKMD